MGKFKVSFFVMGIILLIVFLGLIKVVFGMHGAFFVLELAFLLIIGFFAFISMIAVYNNARWGWIFLFCIFGLILVDLLLIYYRAGNLGFSLMGTIAASLIGFLIALTCIKKKKGHRFESLENVKNVEVSKEFKPGKYVASKKGGRYHIPKCDWAKRIKRSNQVWFNSEAEAKKKGYKADSCIK